MNRFASKWMTRGVPAVVGIGIAWVAVRMVKNEAQLLLRQLELQDALETNSWNEKKKLLRGK